MLPRIVGCPISRSFFARCGIPRTSIGSPQRAKECRSAAVVSHTSRKTSEIWGTPRFLVGTGSVRDVLPGTDQPDSCRQRSAWKLAEGSEIRRVHYVVYYCGIAAARGVFQNAAQAEISAPEVEPPFKAGAERKIVRET